MTARLNELKLNLMLQNGDAYYLIGATRGQQTHYEGPHFTMDSARRAYKQRCASGPQPDKWFLVTVKQIQP
jgi:hypothetical protein